ncbi:MAG: exodeoxyribonuclease VII small subunit [Candidatus Tectomicrobia bacterium]|nr:exodeoxyribonuclease VII small subunit [Candidatus Tectomicrobia bacterium]
MSEMKFEAALKRLEEIVEELEGGNLDLDRSLEIFEEGVKLSRFCAKKLEDAERRIEMLVRNSNGETEIVPFNPENLGEREEKEV